MNVHSVSKLSAAVMTLAILSYCRQKSHDSAAAPAPASQPKTEAPDATAPASTAPASTAVASTAPASTAPASTAPASTHLSCQTADEINTHVTNADHKAEAFCFHKVEHPALSLKDGAAIATDMQLRQGLDVAFLNVKKNFWYAQALCTDPGIGWQAPLSNDGSSTPRAADNSNSLEAVGKYFAGANYEAFWSSSTVSNNVNSAWGVNLGYGTTGDFRTKYNSFDVVCVRW